MSPRPTPTPADQILQAVRRLQDQLRYAYGDRWTLLLDTPDYAIVTKHPRAGWTVRALGSREKGKFARPRTRRRS